MRMGVPSPPLSRNGDLRLQCILSKLIVSVQLTCSSSERRHCACIVLQSIAHSFVLNLIRLGLIAFLRYRLLRRITFQLRVAILIKKSNKLWSQWLRLPLPSPPLHPWPLLLWAPLQIWSPRTSRWPPRHGLEAVASLA